MAFACFPQTRLSTFKDHPDFNHSKRVYQLQNSSNSFALRRRFVKPLHRPFQLSLPLILPTPNLLCLSHETHDVDLLNPGTE